MIKQRIKNHLSIAYENRILIHDNESFDTVFDYLRLLTDLRYNIIHYDDIEQFRYLYETELKKKNEQFAVIVKDHNYIPYDIRKTLYEVDLSLATVYPRLNATILRKYLGGMDLINYAYDTIYSDLKKESQTEEFIKNTAFSVTNITQFLTQAEGTLVSDAKKAYTYLDWINIAKQNARISVYAASIKQERNTQEINNLFRDFVFDSYQKLSGIVSSKAPTILTKTIDWISGGKVALVIVDGMSLFDFEILSRFLSDFDYDYAASYALIPTTTSISRQSLLSGKYPQQLDNPFSLGKEENAFMQATLAHGYTKQQSFYGRGYDAIPGPLIRFAAIIINDIDNIVHGQQQERRGMYNDVLLLADSGKLQKLMMQLLDLGFQVYLTSDHGNTCCIGVGSVKRTGVETETKSKRMIVLRDFADISEDLSDKTFQYPGYYLDKSYRYLICNGNTSFDNKNEFVMTHGGITLEEVIVPFVRIRRKNNG